MLLELAPVAGVLVATLSSAIVEVKTASLGLLDSPHNADLLKEL